MSEASTPLKDAREAVSKNKTAEDRLEWVRHERERHRIYRVKENSYWLTCISNNAGQSRKLWKAFSSIMGIDQVSKTALESPSAQDLLDFFIKKVADIGNRLDPPIL